MVELTSHTSSTELKYLISLKLIKGVGNTTALKLLKHFSSAEAIFKASTTQFSELNIKQDIVQQIKHFDLAQIDYVLNWQKLPNCQILTMGSPLYPLLLKEINSPPFLLFTIGDPLILSSPQIAVVGSRNPTAQGMINATQLTQALTEQGLTITSGLALGIDGEAHRAALANNSYTVAVTGTGLNRVYPASHRDLAHAIAKHGVLVSENLPDDPINQGSFPQRNRIIAGLSLGTLVIEATQKSGSLITAKHAMNEGREVYAVPGSIHNPHAKGCHYLIKQGAKLVESIEDILEDLPSVTKVQINHSKSSTQQVIDHPEADFLKYIDYDLTTIDSIVSRSQLTVEAVTNKLLLLELDGLIINTTGGYTRQ